MTGDEAVVEGRVAGANDVEQERRTAVVEVGRRVPHVVQHRRHVVAEPATVGGDRHVGILEAPGLLGDVVRIGPVEDVECADVVSQERVVPVCAGRRPGIETVADGTRALVGEELPGAGHGRAVVTPRAPRLRIVEEEPAALGDRIGLMRIPHEFRERVDEVGQVRQPDAHDLVGMERAAQIAVRRREVVVHVDRVGRRRRIALHERAQAAAGTVDVFLPVAVPGPHERAQGVLEVLHLVAVAVPVNCQHRIEIAAAIGRRDVRRHQVGPHLAGVAVAAGGVEEALGARGVPAVSRGEPCPAAQVHAVAERRAEL